VIRDAIRRIRDEEERVAAMRAALKVGDDRLDNGQGNVGPRRSRRREGQVQRSTR
jgi:Arc/MetJ-type ribon-helix-helix transcriptional regulator